MVAGQLKVKMPILLGLLFVLAVLFVPTPQRPAYCGGGSVIWSWQKPPVNADYIEDLIRANQTNPYKRTNRFWGLEDNGQVTLCETSGGAQIYWLISSDKPDAVIIEKRFTGAPFK